MEDLGRQLFGEVSDRLSRAFLGSASRFRVQGLRFRVWGSGFRVLGFRV